jgi:hypothetical protein
MRFGCRRACGDRSVTGHGVDDPQPFECPAFINHIYPLGRNVALDVWNGVRQGERMTATQLRPINVLSPLATGVRTAVGLGSDWAGAAQLVAEEPRRHLPALDVLTAAQRVGSPDDSCATTLYRTDTEGRTGRSRSSLWCGGPTSVTDPRSHDVGCAGRDPRSRAE